MRELAELSPISYYDAKNTVQLDCYADTFVYHKASGSVRNLVAMRFGGYPEQVRAMTDVLRSGAGLETTIEGHKIILIASHEAYKRSVTHDGIYAEGTMLALDDENSEMTDDEQLEVDNPNQKRKMYIFCDEGDTDSLYAELDKKTAIPLIPEFKEYILAECFKKKILIPLEVLSVSVRFDAYMLEVRNDEKEIEQIVNEGLKTGKDGLSSTLNDAVTEAKNLLNIKHILCALKSGNPKINTDGKIPDSHIVFLDEIFKANDGILNSLLTAVNEKVYTNEGQTVDIPVISFFSASNEIPNFNDSTQAILKPLYDRFELKVLTEYVKEKDNRMKVLKNKQDKKTATSSSAITLDELIKMQSEAEKVKVPEEINELMDNVLCELRKNNIHVSDRKYFGFTPIVRAKAYLSGNAEVKPQDLLILKNYFWNEPSQIPTVGNILTNICENPIGAKTAELVEMARESFSELSDFVRGKDRTDADTELKIIKLYSKSVKELIRIYAELSDLKNEDLSEADYKAVEKASRDVDELNSLADDIAKTTHIPLAEKMRLNV